MCHYYNMYSKGQTKNLLMYGGKMGISEEAIRARAAVPEQYRPTDNAVLAQGFAESSLQAEDITIIDENGNEVVLDGATTEAERRNAAVTAQGRAGDQEFEALRAGTSNRIDTTGLSQKERDDARARSRENANADARMQALLALQAQLDAAYEAADRDVAEMLDPHLTDEERDYLAGIEDAETLAKEQLRIAREKLASGEMPQSKYDKFKTRWDDREDIRDTRAETTAKLASLKGMSAPVVEQAVEQRLHETDAANMAAISRALDTNVREVAEAATNNHVQAGNDAQENNDADNFGLAELTDDDLFGEPEASPGVSFSTAHQHGDENPLRDIVPDIQGHHGAAAGNIDQAEPEAQVELRLASHAAPTISAG